MKHKVLCHVAALALIVASAVTCKELTGQCPLGWLMSHVHAAHHAEQTQAKAGN